MKKLVSLKLSRQTVPAKIENARNYVTQMTGNASFTAPNPSLADVTTAINNLEVAYTNALGGGKVLTSLMRDKEAILDNLLTQLSHYVEGVANGSETIILSAGMNLKAIASGGRATGFKVKQGDQSGELKLSTSYERNNAYIWEMVEDPLPDEVDSTHSWRQVAVTIKASLIVDNLVAGLKYWFRVANVNKDGQNDWSNPVGKMVSE